MFILFSRGCYKEATRLKKKKEEDEELVTRRCALARIKQKILLLRASRLHLLRVFARLGCIYHLLLYIYFAV